MSGQVRRRGGQEARGGRNARTGNAPIRLTAASNLGGTGGISMSQQMVGTLAALAAGPGGIEPRGSATAHLPAVISARRSNPSIPPSTRPSAAASAVTAAAAAAAASSGVAPWKVPPGPLLLHGAATRMTPAEARRGRLAAGSSSAAPSAASSAPSPSAEVAASAGFCSSASPSPSTTSSIGSASVAAACCALGGGGGGTLPCHGVERSSPRLSRMGVTTIPLSSKVCE